MNKIIEPEKTELRLRLMSKVGEFIDKLPDNNIGWVPDNIVETMTDAAFAVLMAVHGVNIYMDEQDLIK